MSYVNNLSVNWTKLLGPFEAFLNGLAFSMCICSECISTTTLLPVQTINGYLNKCVFYQFNHI